MSTLATFYIVRTSIQGSSSKLSNPELREVARLQVGATREKRRSASPCAPCRQDVGVVRGDNGRLSGAVAAECGGTVEIGGSSIAGLSSLARG